MWFKDLFAFCEVEMGISLGLFYGVDEVDVPVVQWVDTPLWNIEIQISVLTNVNRFINNF